MGGPEPLQGWEQVAVLEGGGARSSLPAHQPEEGWGEAGREPKPEPKCIQATRFFQTLI